MSQKQKNKKDLPKAVPRRKGSPPPNHVPRKKPWSGGLSDLRTRPEDVIPVPPSKPDPAIESVKEKRALAEAYIDEVGIKKVEKDFAEKEFNRAYIVAAAKNRGIDLTQRFVDSVEMSYEMGMNENLNAVRPDITLNCRKHVTGEVGTLAKLHVKDDETHDVNLNITFNKIDINIGESNGNKEQIYPVRQATDIVEQSGDS